MRIWICIALVLFSCTLLAAETEIYVSIHPATTQIEQGQIIRMKVRFYNPHEAAVRTDLKFGTYDENLRFEIRHESQSQFEPFYKSEGGVTRSIPVKGTVVLPPREARTEYCTIGWRSDGYAFDRAGVWYLRARIKNMRDIRGVSEPVAFLVTPLSAEDKQHYEANFMMRRGVGISAADVVNERELKSSVAGLKSLFLRKDLELYVLILRLRESASAEAMTAALTQLAEYQQPRDAVTREIVNYMIARELYEKKKDSTARLYVELLSQESYERTDLEGGLNFRKQLQATGRQGVE